MLHPRNNRLLENARSLRKNLTKEERRLWYDFLRGYPIPFRRQEIVGSYIADFYCSKAKLIVELDGSQHYDEEEMLYDQKRTAFFNGLGYRVLRFSNLDVLQNFRGVCEQIQLEVKGRTPQSPAATAPLSGEPQETP